MAAFVPILWCFYYYSSVLHLEMGDDYTSLSSFITQDFFRYLGFSVFTNEAGKCLSRSMENCLEISMGIALNQ